VIQCPHTLKREERDRACSQCLIAPASRKVQRLKPARVEIPAVEIRESDDDDANEVSQPHPRDDSPTRPLDRTPEKAIAEFLAAVDGGYRCASPTMPPREERPAPVERPPTPRSIERWRAMRAAEGKGT
jgi:hypothetical protein